MYIFQENVTSNAVRRVVLCICSIKMKPRFVLFPSFNFTSRDFNLRGVLLLRDLIYQEF